MDKDVIELDGLTKLLQRIVDGEHIPEEQLEGQCKRSLTYAVLKALEEARSWNLLESENAQEFLAGFPQFEHALSKIAALVKNENSKVEFK